MSEVELSQASLDEALDPKLSRDFFIIIDKEKQEHRINVTAMKIGYQKQFVKECVPLFDHLASELVLAGKFSELKVGDFCSAMSGLAKQVDLYPKLLQILCKNSDWDVSIPDLEECVMPFGEVGKILFEAFRRSGEFNKEIADFFTTAWKQGQLRLRAKVREMIAENAELESAGNTTSTP